MDPTFHFEAASSDEGSESEEEATPTQSPWEFASYSKSVAEEHAQRNTTSIDDKISRSIRYNQPVISSLPDPHDQEDEEEEEEEEQDIVFNHDDSTKGVGKNAEEGAKLPFFASSEGTSFSAKSFLDLNLTRPLIRACESLGYQKPTPIQGVGKNAEEGAKLPFFASSEGTSFSAKSFLDLNLTRPLIRACESLGYQKPTPIQAACIPLALTGRDICGSALTGSGKTAAFALPVLERLLHRPKHIPAIRVLILAPARELAVQVHSMIEKLAQFTDIRCCLVVGGLSTKVQEAALRSMPDIVVATPGRMIDHLRNSLSVGLEDLSVLILDEADRLLETSFSGEIQALIGLCPKRERQTMLFSATMTEEVDKLVKLSLIKPVRLEADPSTRRPATLTEEVVRIRRMREANQEAVLLALCSKTFTKEVIIFSGTKQAAHRLKILFGLAGLRAAELHGNLTQVQRLDALEIFRKHEVDFLIATDVAARGLDIIGVQTVINFACPRDITSYTHRVGRTARAGREGYAVTFVTDIDRSLLRAIAKKVGSRLKSRIVAEQPVAEWIRLIEQMEDQITSIIQEEREEKALRKAEMEATKAENMIKHKDEIFSRPKRTWFATEREKMLIAKAAKASLDQTKNGPEEVVSAEQAEELKLKEKRKMEREKKLPRKKRRRLEAAREMLENEEDDNDTEKQTRGGTKGKTGQSLVDVGYRRAKAMKSVIKAHGTGKKLRTPSVLNKQPSPKNQSRKEEMLELFQNDMSERKQSRTSRKNNNLSGGRKTKSSFKSKSRYKRRK